MYIHRILENPIRNEMNQYPIVAVLGPRQSGKTTIVRACFPTVPYLNLEDLDTRMLAIQDPRGFLSGLSKGAIIDEVQRVPDLFSYLQTHVDKTHETGQFILTGSQNFLLMENITQSLAGRVSLFKLLPASLEELLVLSSFSSLEEALFKGGYPILYQRELNPSRWYQNYLETYVEKDVRQIQSVEDLGQFSLFIRLCAGRIGQLLNLSSLANDCGITHTTAKRWISILEASFIIFLLRPYHKNFGKRLVKMPKLYFYDTGLASALLGIQESPQLLTHASRGALFENLVITEIVKHKHNHQKSLECYFWRDNTGNELDCLIENRDSIIALEIKSGKTINRDFFKGLQYWEKLNENQLSKKSLIYGGETQSQYQGVDVIPWLNMAEFLKKTII
jgi:predicted AAA+ superfamily ATPase